MVDRLEYTATWMDRLYHWVVVDHPRLSSFAGIFLFSLVVATLTLTYQHLSRQPLPANRAIEGFVPAYDEILSDKLPGVRYSWGVADTVYIPGLVKPERQGANFLYFKVNIILESGTQDRLVGSLSTIPGVVAVHKGRYGVAIERDFSPGEESEQFFPWNDILDKKGVVIKRGIALVAKRVLIEAIRLQFEKGHDNKKTGASNRDPSFYIFIYIYNYPYTVNGGTRPAQVVPKEGLEPSRLLSHTHLKRCLPR